MVTIKTPKNIKLKKLPLLKLVYASIGINLITIFLVLILQRNLPPEVPLFYGLAEGEGQVAGSLWLLFPASLSFLILLANTSLVLLLKVEFLQKTLVLTSLAVSALSMITTIKIILLVGSF